LLIEGYQDGRQAALPPETGDGCGMAAPARDLWNWLELLWEARRTLLRWSLAGFALAAVLAMVVPRKYEATARQGPVQPRSMDFPRAPMELGSAAGQPEPAGRSD